MEKQGCIYRVISWFGQRLIVIVEMIFRKHSSVVENAPLWAKQLCKHKDNICAEFLRLYDENLRELSVISPEQRRITAGKSWKVFILRAFGRTLVDNCARCPETKSLIENVSGLSTVMFSVLEPDTYLSPHRGVYAGVLRCHIPLIIPAGDCGIRVGAEIYRWQLGVPLVFDDTLEHEAWNRTTERRVVLLIDFLRPLPLPLALVNKFMIWLIGHSPFVARGLRASL